MSHQITGCTPVHTRLISFSIVVLILSLSLLVTMSGCGGGSSATNTPPPPPPFSLTFAPTAPAMTPGSSLTVFVTATNPNAGLPPSFTLGPLPPGITSTTAFPVSVPPSGTTFNLTTDAKVAVGSYNLIIQETVGSSSSSSVLSLTVAQGLGGVGFAIPLSPEVQVIPGGAGTFAFQTLNSSPDQIEVTLSASGLPPGVTATIQPNPLLGGQGGNVVLRASSTAPSVQNAEIMLTATPTLSVPASSMTFLLDVLPPSGNLPDNRTDHFSTGGRPYISADGIPFGEAFDSKHNLIFASVPSLNQVQVVDASTHFLRKALSIRDPRGLDVSPDNSRVWVVTGSRQVFEIDTATLAVQQHLLPPFSNSFSFGATLWEGDQVLSVADGTLVMDLSAGKYSGSRVFVIWDPSTNNLTPLPMPTPGANPNPLVTTGIPLRSGDGKRVYAFNGDSNGNSFYYDVPTHSVGPSIAIGGGEAAAINYDASRIAIFDGSAVSLYDSNLNLLGQVPGGGLLGGYPDLHGGMTFSSINGNLYEICMPYDIPVIVTVDTTTFNLIGLAPAIPFIPVMTELDPPFYLSSPFAVDSTGNVLAVQYYGIAFEDSTYQSNFVTNQPGSPVFMQHMAPYSGPLAGGTVSGGFGNGFSITPTVWYGKNEGTAQDTNYDLTITSPNSDTSGPVNLKMLFPDGMEVFDPLFFSYGPYVEVASTSGASPAGGTSGEIAGFGMPIDAGGGSLSIGGNSATITTTQTQYLPFVGTPYPDTYLHFTIPAGQPGWADIAVSTPAGTSTLPKSLFYAKSVTDYSSTDSFSAVLFDPGRNQLYVSAGDHIDVFSLQSGQFATPITPPSLGSTRQFKGLTLSVGGAQLLAADFTDYSTAVINPDNLTNSFAIATNPNTQPPPTPPCSPGPIFLASLAGQKAILTTGTLPTVGIGASGCSAGPGPTMIVDLTNKSASVASNLPEYYFLSASTDGQTAAVGGLCIYSLAQNSCNSLAVENATGGVAISGDGKTAFEGMVLADTSGFVSGRIAQPDVLFMSKLATPFTRLDSPVLNETGSLVFIPYQHCFEIYDVLHGRLLMRFSLSETISPVATPLATDPSGQRVFLLTDKGLTVVDLGTAPLAVGSLTPTSGSPGSQITIRGSGFLQQTSVTLGGVATTSTYINSETLAVVIPTLQPGPADLVLSNPDGSSYSLTSALPIL